MSVIDFCEWSIVTDTLVLPLLSGTWSNRVSLDEHVQTAQIFELRMFLFCPDSA